jgi:hypothetical protein
MPRKSAASLAVLRPPDARPQPPEPPAELTPSQARIWRDVAASRPADWFDAGAGTLLVAFCRHVDTGNTLAGLIAATEPTDKRYRSLLLMAARQSSMVAMLASKLRLAPSNTRRIETKIPSVSDRPPPWGRHI